MSGVATKKRKKKSKEEREGGSAEMYNEVLG